ncbi:vegetative cell wall protein gp1-like [Leguminivora glycinivorella]|uniref:vegetative cell wall protein gp1-like n=1 Tax=Leguminivora glycinivorella TaxID=1035111 RepID=UPI00200E6DDA|nr:vegetative cell wall protein gp1-like [Leguminivora glycinivorella]
MSSEQPTKMTTRRDVLIAKMQQLQKELKTANELNKKLLQEQEESEQEIERVVRTNTTLKNQLANQDVEYEDLQGQRDELQAIVNRFQQCQDIHELALQRVRDLQQQLEESESKHICKYCSGNPVPADNNMKPGSGYNLSFESPRPPTRPAAPSSPALRAVLAAPGSPALRALFASRPSPALEPSRDLHPVSSFGDPAPVPAQPPSSPPGVVERVPSRPSIAGPAPSPPALVEPASSPPSLATLALALLTYVSPAPAPPPLVSPPSPRLAPPSSPPPRPPPRRAPRRRRAPPAPAPCCTATRRAPGWARCWRSASTGASSTTVTRGPQPKRS